MDELMECPYCGEPYPQGNTYDSPSLIVHALREHPDELLAANIREAIVDAEV